MDFFKEGWYLLYTRLNFEMEIADRLAKKNIQYFLPLIGQPGHGHVKRRIKKTPLFPSYIFIKLITAEDYGKFNDSGFTGDCMKPGRKPVWVPEEIINQVRVATDKAECMYASAQYFQPGEQVELGQGVLSGVSGELIQYNGKKKILIRVNIINRCILIDLPAEYIPVTADIAC
jgi:transcription antitermination factor NusG